MTLDLHRCRSLLRRIEHELSKPLVRDDAEAMADIAELTSALDVEISAHRAWLDEEQAFEFQALVERAQAQRRTA